jgi:hypothetical protein
MTFSSRFLAFTDPARKDYEETGCPTLAAPLFLRLGWDLMSHFNLAGSLAKDSLSLAPTGTQLADAWPE